MDRKWRGLGAGAFFFVAGAMENGTWFILLPTIGDHFDVPASTVVWIFIAFALGMAGSALTAGHIGDVIGHKRVATIGFIAEGAMLVLIVIAPVFWLILVLRFIQGIARATGLNAIGAVVINNWPREQRGRILGIRNSLAATGLLLGPLYGGLVGQALGWRAAFIGIVILYGIQVVLVVTLAPATSRGGGRAWATLRRLDWAGAVAFMVGIAAFLLAAQSFRWQNAVVLGLAAAAIAAGMITLAVWFERRSEAPVLNLGLLRSPTFSWATVSLILFTMAFGASVFLFPFFLQKGLLWTLGLAGLVLMTLNIVQAVASPYTGALADRVGVRRVQGFGVAVMVSGLLVGSRLGVGAEVWQVVGVMLIIGAGMTLFSPPNNRIIYDAVPQTAIGAANAATAVGRYVGQSLGGAIAASLLASMAAEGVPAAFRSSMLILALIVGIGVTVTILAPLLLKVPKPVLQS